MRIAPSSSPGSTVSSGSTIPRPPMRTPPMPRCRRMPPWCGSSAACSRASTPNRSSRGTPTRLRAVIVIGEDRSVLLEAFERHAPGVPVLEVSTSQTDQVMSAAVRAAASVAQSGDVVLLAPAAASMDQFTDYADRGRQFTAAVQERLGGARDDDADTSGEPDARLSPIPSARGRPPRSSRSVASSPPRHPSTSCSWAPRCSWWSSDSSWCSRPRRSSRACRTATSSRRRPARGSTR